jgi:hypothetical protein
MKPHSIIYKTTSTIVEASGVALTPATRHSLASKPNKQTPGVLFTPATQHNCASRPNKQTPGTALTTTTRHGSQPQDFLKILSAIPADSKYVSDPTRPIPAQYIPPTKKGWKTHGTRPWVTHAPTPAPYHRGL